MLCSLVIKLIPKYKLIYQLFNVKDVLCFMEGAVLRRIWHSFRDVKTPKGMLIGSAFEPTAIPPRIVSVCDIAYSVRLGRRLKFVNKHIKQNKYIRCHSNGS